LRNTRRADDEIDVAAEGMEETDQLARALPGVGWVQLPLRNRKDFP